MVGGDQLDRIRQDVVRLRQGGAAVDAGGVTIVVSQLGALIATVWGNEGADRPTNNKVAYRPELIASWLDALSSIWEEADAVSLLVQMGVAPLAGRSWSLTTSPPQRAAFGTNETCLAVSGCLHLTEERTYRRDFAMAEFDPVRTSCEIFAHRRRAPSQRLRGQTTSMSVVTPYSIVRQWQCHGLHVEAAL